jgi:hypothetical protein
VKGPPARVLPSDAEVRLCEGKPYKDLSPEVALISWYDSRAYYDIN